ncbi:uncharacterized protein LOC144431983 [Styela clava]
MNSDDDEMDQGSELELMSQEWNKICQNRFKEGFVDGTTVGQKQSLQEAFNAGFHQGFLSNFLLSKIRGILSALLAYQVSYEGHPITDATLLETHSLLEEIESLETNAVAEEFLKMSLHQNSQSQSVPDEIIQSFSASTSLHPSNNSAQTSNKIGNEPEQASEIQDIDLEGAKNLTIKQVNAIILQCPPIMKSVNRCKNILKSLNWTDAMIDSLL